MSNDDKSLAHSRRNCKCHIVFTPKCRGKEICGKLKKNIGQREEHSKRAKGRRTHKKAQREEHIREHTVRRLCNIKEVEVIEAHAMPDYIHMLVKIPPKLSVSRFMGYLKGRSAVLIHEKHANLKYKFESRTFWAKCDYVSTVELNQKTIEKYIREQKADDRVRDSITKIEYKDPSKKQRKIKRRLGSGRWSF